MRALRTASGLTGETVARRSSMSAAKLSKIENGRTMPTVRDVELILSALNVSEAAKEQFLATVRAEVTEATAWRLLRRMGPWKHQQAIRAIEKTTVTLRLFQGQLIPGLLQTPEYATAVFSLPPALPAETRARTVAARLERQAVLYEGIRAFHFVICEHVLRWLICEPAVMAVQACTPPPRRWRVVRMWRADGGSSAGGTWASTSSPARHTASDPRTRAPCPRSLQDSCRRRPQELRWRRDPARRGEGRTALRSPRCAGWQKPASRTDRPGGSRHPVGGSHGNEGEGPARSAGRAQEVPRRPGRAAPRAGRWTGRDRSLTRTP
ncbi:Scr1 family TA system antitoxin-like transcriptional regulator [Streptomyces sp. NPDC003090]|uniref:Scr1 family TA system antitoxin-like transcriptional regulator n=1 Tax=Streptomyces sp. NPDC003090 TaxID=3154274 RepID=UPI0037FB6B1F